MDSQRSVHLAVKERLLCLWFLITRKEVQHHIGHIGYWGWYESLKLMFLTTGASSKASRLHPGVAFGVLSLCPPWHAARHTPAGNQLLAYSWVLCQNLMPGPRRCYRTLIWHVILSGLILTQWLVVGTDQKTLFINWELYIQGCTLSDPSVISVIHTKVAAILLDETLCLTPRQEAKLLAQWRPWCSELLQNAWAWFTNVDTFWATEQLNSW